MTAFLFFAFLTGTLLAMGAIALTYRSPAAQRLERLAGGALDRESGPSVAAQLETLLAPLARLGGGSSEEVRERLVQAGYRNERTLVLFLGGRLVAPIAAGLLALVLGPVLQLEPGQRWISLLFAVGFTYLAPSFILDHLRTKRQAEIRRALPDALDLLLVCLEAGQALAAAFGRVSKELIRTSPAACEELRLVTMEMQAGKSLAEALTDFAERVGIEEVRALVAMLIQTERFGTSVGEALRVHTDGMRRDRLQTAEEKAQKAAVKMMVPAAGLILPATLLVVIGPPMIKVFEVFK